MTDTEGRWGPVGRHYPMVVTAAADGFERWLFKGRPLTTGEMLKWLVWALPRKRFGYCGFFFDYDQSMILHTMPEGILRRLYRSKDRVTMKTPPQTAVAGRYVIDRFHTKISIVAPFTIPDEVPENLQGLRGARIDIWDVGKFYNQGFAKVLGNYPDLVSNGEAAFVERMKAQRADFDPAYWDVNAEEIIRYSLLENRLLARIQTRFDADAEAQGYPLRMWYGAGSLAKSMLTHEGTVAHLEAAPPIDPAMWEPIDWSYFGGRFEIQRPGVIEEDVWEHDISSAYPASYRVLPCRRHGRWTHRTTRPRTFAVADLYRVKWNVTGSRFGPFPVRSQDYSVCYPACGEGWYWGHEVVPAVDLWGRRAISIREAWVYSTDCDCPFPLEWIHKPYQRRRALGKSAAGYPLKIGMNAVYGSLLSPLSETYWDPIWGSMITAYCRGQLLQAMAKASSLDAVVMLATDAIYTTERLDLPEGPNLGEWEVVEVGPGGILIQPGLYFFPKGEAGTTKYKSRGISLQDAVDNIDRFYDEWARCGADGVVSVPIKPRFVGIRSALHRNKLAEVGWRWNADTRLISFDPWRKRQPTPFGYMPITEVTNPRTYQRFLAAWDPARFPLPDDEPDPTLLYLDSEMPEGPVT